MTPSTLAWEALSSSRPSAQDPDVLQLSTEVASVFRVYSLGVHPTQDEVPCLREGMPVNMPLATALEFVIGEDERAIYVEL